MEITRRQWIASVVAALSAANPEWLTAADQSQGLEQSPAQGPPEPLVVFERGSDSNKWDRDIGTNEFVFNHFQFIRLRVSDEGEPLSVVLKRHVASPEDMELAATLRHVVDDGQVYEFRLRFYGREAIPPKTPEELREEAEEELWCENPLGAYMQLLP